MRPPGPDPRNSDEGPGPGSRPDDPVVAVRERIYASTLRLGLLIRAYVLLPDRRLQARHSLAELQHEARNISDQVQSLSHGHPRPAVVSAGAEADRLVAMLTAVRKVFAHLERLERRNTAESPGDAGPESARLRAEMDRLVAKVSEGEEQVHSLESDLVAVRRLRVREASRVDEVRRLRRRVALAEARADRASARGRTLRRKLKAAEDKVKRLRRRPRRGKGAAAKMGRSGRPPGSKRRTRSR